MSADHKRAAAILDIWEENLRLKADNARLRADKERLDFLDSQVWPDGKRTDPNPPIIQLVAKRLFNPHDEWVNCAQNARATIDAARAALGEECPYCTNGIIRSLGRDNDEIIEDCPYCAARGEGK